MSGDEDGAAPYSDGSECQCCNEPPAVADATGGHDRNWGDNVHYLRYEGHSRYPAGVASRLNSLSNYYIHAGFNHPACSSGMTDDADYLYPAAVALIDIWPGVSQPCCIDGDAVLQNDLDLLFEQVSGPYCVFRHIRHRNLILFLQIRNSKLLLQFLYEVGLLRTLRREFELELGRCSRFRHLRRQHGIDAEGFIGKALGIFNKLIYLIRGQECTSQHPQPTSVGHRSHKLGAGNRTAESAHPRQNDRVFDIQHVAQPGSKSVLCHIV